MAGALVHGPDVFIPNFTLGGTFPLLGLLAIRATYTDLDDRVTAASYSFYQDRSI